MHGESFSFLGVFLQDILSFKTFKALAKPDIRCFILSFLTRVAQKVFYAPFSNSWG